VALAEIPKLEDGGFGAGGPPAGPRPAHGLGRAFGHSADGYAFALRSERAFRLEVITLAISIPTAFWISADPLHRALLIASLIVVVVVELLNTAIEKLCDLVQPTSHPSVKAVKDMGSAAVLSAVAAAFLLWVVALWDRLI